MFSSWLVKHTLVLISCLPSDFIVHSCVYISRPPTKYVHIRSYIANLCDRILENSSKSHIYKWIYLSLPAYLVLPVLRNLLVMHSRNYPIHSKNTLKLHIAMFTENDFKYMVKYSIFHM